MRGGQRAQAWGGWECDCRVSGKRWVRSFEGYLPGSVVGRRRAVGVEGWIRGRMVEWMHHGPWMLKKPRKFRGVGACRRRRVGGSAGGKRARSS